MISDYKLIFDKFIKKNQTNNKLYTFQCLIFKFIYIYLAMMEYFTLNLFVFKYFFSFQKF